VNKIERLHVKRFKLSLEHVEALVHKELLKIEIENLLDRARGKAMGLEYSLNQANKPQLSANTLKTHDNNST